MRRATVALFASGLAVLAMGCGGDSGNSIPTPPGPTPVLTGAARDLVELLDAGTRVQYTLGYRVTDSEGVEGDAYTVFNKPPLTRIDTVSSSRVTSLVIGGDRDTTTVSCTAGQDWKCYEIDPLGDSLLEAAGPVVFVSAFDAAERAVVEEPGRTVAGQPVRCFSLTEAAGGERQEYCLRPDGVPLYVEASTGIVEAWTISNDVDDSDFIPPAEPQAP